MNADDAERDAGHDDESARSTSDGEHGGSTAPRDVPGADPPRAEGVPADRVDEELKAEVTDDLADLAEDEADYPAMDDPVDAQSIDVENAAFVVLGFLATVALLAHMVSGLF